MDETGLLDVKTNSLWKFINSLKWVNYILLPNGTGKKMNDIINEEQRKFDIDAKSLLELN